MAAGPFARAPWTILATALWIVALTVAIGEGPWPDAVIRVAGRLDLAVLDLAPMEALRGGIIFPVTVLVAILADAKGATVALRVGSLVLALAWSPNLFPSTTTAIAMFIAIQSVGLAACGVVVLTSAVVRAAPVASRSLWLALFTAFSMLITGLITNLGGPVHRFSETMLPGSPSMSANTASYFFLIVLALSIFPIATLFRQVRSPHARPHWNDRPIPTLKAVGSLPSYWLVAACLCLTGLGDTALIAFLRGFKEAQLGSPAVSIGLGIASAASFCAILFFGWAGTRWPVKRIVLVVFAIKISGVAAAVIQPSGIGLVIATTVALGIGSSAVLTVLFVTLLADTFGTKNFTTIISIPISVSVFIGFFGVLFAGIGIRHDLLGVTETVIVLAFIPIVIGLVLAWFVDDSPLPQPADEEIVMQFD